MTKEMRAAHQMIINTLKPIQNKIEHALRISTVELAYDDRERQRGLEAKEYGDDETLGSRIEISDIKQIYEN